MSKALLHRLFIAFGLSMFMAGLAWPTVVLADDLVIHATVPALPEHFQLDLFGSANGAEFASGTVVTYTMTYGSNLSVPTDIMVIEFSWSQGQLPNSSWVNLLQFVSAGQAINNTDPVFDLPNRKVTWTISPVPPTNNHQVELKLQLTNAYLGDELIPLAISARLIGPGVELPTLTKLLNYHYLQPSPTPSPTLTPTPGPTESSPSATLVPPVGQISPSPRRPGSSSNNPPGSGLLDNLNLDEIIPDISDQAEQIADNGGAAAAAPVALLFLLGPLINLILQLVPYLSWWQLPGLLGALFLNRKRRSWGVVYDSLSKLPLDPALVSLTDARGRTYQSITDIYGRYQFLVGPGRYHLKVEKTNYRFPSTVMTDQKDPVYEDVYLGQEIVVDDASNIHVNIPMDPLQPDWNQQAKLEFGLAHQPRFNGHWRTYIFGAGFIWCLVMACLSPNPINLAMVGVYVMLALGVYWYRHRHPWGVIEEAHHPLANAVVTIENLQQPRLKFPPVVTNATGRYAFLVAGGDYRVKVALPKDHHQFTDYLIGPTVHVDGQYGAIHQDLQVEDAQPTQPS